MKVAVYDLSHFVRIAEVLLNITLIYGSDKIIKARSEEMVDNKNQN